MALDVESYPRARTSRSGAGGVATGAGGVSVDPPTSRTFAFRLDMNIGNRSTVSTPLLHGPAIIRSLHATQSAAAFNVHVLELGKSSSPIVETDVAIATAKAWTPFFERLSGTVAPESALRVGTLELDTGAPGGIRDDALGIIVLEAEFFLVISWQSLGVSGASLSGHVNILEKVPPETIAYFQ